LIWITSYTLKLVILPNVKAEHYHHMTDADLLDRYASDGNSEWIGILLERYTLLLFGLCMKYLKNEEEAKDAVQQIFLKVLGEAGKYKIEFFKSWLYMVAKNHCLMGLRGRQGRITREITDWLPLVAEEGNISLLLQNEKTYAWLEQAMKELDEKQRQCVTLFYLGKQSYFQVSEQTGFSLLQVKSYIQNGKRNLRQTIERKMKESSLNK